MNRAQWRKQSSAVVTTPGTGPTRRHQRDLLQRRGHERALRMLGSQSFSAAVSAACD